MPRSILGTWFRQHWAAAISVECLVYDVSSFAVGWLRGETAVEMFLASVALASRDTNNGMRQTIPPPAISTVTTPRLFFRTLRYIRSR